MLIEEVEFKLSHPLQLQSLPSPGCLVPIPEPERGQDLQDPGPEPDLLIENIPLTLIPKMTMEMVVVSLKLTASNAT